MTSIRSSRNENKNFIFPFVVISVYQKSYYISRHLTPDGGRPACRVDYDVP